MAVRAVLRRTPWLKPAVDLARPLYRSARTAYLRQRFPEGAFLRCHGVSVFCDFSDPTFAWYDADAPNLAFDQHVLRRVLPQCVGNVFIDVGAHFGFYSGVVAQAVQGLAAARVLAIEPDQRKFACLVRTLEPYAHVTDVLPLAVALGDADASVTLYRSGGSCLHSFADADAVACGSAQGLTLDTLVKNQFKPGDRLAFVKVDIDGAEPRLLAGGQRTLAEHRPVIFVEYAPACLKRASVAPRAFFDHLCAGRFVYWVDADAREVRQVGCSDYPDVAAAVGDRVTDLLVSDSPLDVTLS